MQEQYSPSPFELADQSFLAALPKRSIATDEDLTKIKLPGVNSNLLPTAAGVAHGGSPKE